jgi:predicted DNA-binding protein (UPF0251 family)
MSCPPYRLTPPDAAPAQHQMLIAPARFRHDAAQQSGKLLIALETRFSRTDDYATKACRRPIKMSLLCQIEMTLPRIFREVPGVTVRLMSDKEITRLEVLRDLDQRRLRPTAAAQLMGLERRQVFRLLKDNIS